MSHLCGIFDYWRFRELATVIMARMWHSLLMNRKFIFLWQTQRPDSHDRPLSAHENPVALFSYSTLHSFTWPLSSHAPAITDENARIRSDLTHDNDTIKTEFLRVSKWTAMSFAIHIFTRWICPMVYDCSRDLSMAKGHRVSFILFDRKLCDTENCAIDTYNCEELQQWHIIGRVFIVYDGIDDSKILQIKRRKRKINKLMIT